MKNKLFVALLTVLSFGLVGFNDAPAGSDIMATGHPPTLILRLDDLVFFYLGDADDSSIHYDGSDLIIKPDEVGTGTLIVDGHLGMLGHNITDVGIMYQIPASGDVAPTAATIKAGNAWIRAAANPDGAALVLAGGVGVGKATCLQATGDQTVLYFTACDATGCTTTTVTEDTGTGGDWDCLTDDNTCCDALETYVNGLALKFQTACAANILWVNHNIGTTHFALTSANGAGAGTAFVVVDGDEGSVVIGPDLAMAIGPTEIDVGLNTDMNGYRLNDSTGALMFGTADCTLGHGGITGSVCFDADAGGVSGEVDGTWFFDAAVTFSGNGSVNFNQSGHTKYNDNIAALFGASNDITLQFRNTQTPNTFLLGVGSEARSFVMIESADLAVSFDLPQQDDPTLAFQSSDGTKIGQRSAINYAGIWADHPVTDIDPHDTYHNSADAWSRATGGQRDGATHNISAGIRTLQHVCSDRTLTDTDTITITVNGADTVLTESTDFDCEGEASEEVCCDNIGAAITTALGATIVVPDCDTTAGTCYLQFNQRNVHAVEDIVYADGGVNGVGWTLTEGTDGTINIHHTPVFADYTRHHDVPIGAAIVGAAAPGQETIGTFRCYVFDANADLAYINVEVPSEWNGSSDMATDLLIFADDGDALANGEVIEFDLVYRSVAVGEAYDNGAAVTATASVTGGGAEVDKGQYKITATVDYDHGDQPLGVNDTLGFSIMRDVDNDDTYSGDVHVCRAQLVYQANTLATH